MHIVKNLQSNSVVKVGENNNSPNFRANKFVSKIAEKVTDKTMKKLAAAATAIATASIAMNNGKKQIDENFEDEIIATLDFLEKKSNVAESKLFLKVLCVCQDEKILKKICTDPNILRDMLDDEEKIKELNCKQTEALSDNLILNLQLMKRFYPDEYTKLSLSKGFKEIKAGSLNAKILENLKYNDKIDANYFYRIFENIEKDANSKIKEIVKGDQKYAQSIKEVLEIDPSQSKDILEYIQKAKQPYLMKQIVYLVAEDYRNLQNEVTEKNSNENYVAPKDIALKNKIFISLLKNASVLPNITNFALEFDANTFNTLALIEVIKSTNVSLGVKKEVRKILEKYKTLIGVQTAIKSFQFIERTDDLVFLDRILKEFIQKDKPFYDVDTILDHVTDDNLDCFEQKLNKGDLTIYSVADILALGDVEEFYEFDNQEQILSMLKKHTDYFDSYMEAELEDIKEELGKYIQAYASEKDLEKLASMKKVLSNFLVANLNAKKNYVPLVNIELSNPELYKKIEESGVIELIQNEVISSNLLFKLNDNSEINSKLLEDLEMYKKDASTIIKFSPETTLAQALSKTKCGDVLSIGEQLYINDGSPELYKWSLTKDQYQELFPLVTRFETTQGKLSDCYLISALISCMENRQARSEIYKSFSSSGEDITVTIKAYEKYGGSYTFKNGEIDLSETGANLLGCVGLQMLEQAYARVAFRDERLDSLPKLTNKTHVAAIMPRISGGLVNNVMSEVLGVENLGVKRALPSDVTRSTACIYIDNNNAKNKENFCSILTALANNKDYILNFGTISSKDEKIESVLNYDYNILSQHAYSIKGYNPDTNMVQIINSHCGAVVTNVPLEELSKYIEQLYVTSLK